MSPSQTLFGYVLQESLVQTLMTQNMAVFVSVALPQDPELITNATVDSSWREWHGESARTMGDGLERHQFAQVRESAKIAKVIYMKFHTICFRDNLSRP